MVDMAVRKHDTFDLLRIEWEMLVPLLGFMPAALIKPAVEQDTLAVDLNEVLGASGGARSTAEGDFHPYTLAKGMAVVTPLFGKESFAEFVCD
jgi:hypothetical protein